MPSAPSTLDPMNLVEKRRHTVKQRDRRRRRLIVVLSVHSTRRRIESIIERLALGEAVTLEERILLKKYSIIN